MNDELASIDVQLWQQMAGGNDGAFDQLFERHNPRLLAYLRARVNSADAEDLSQTIWLRIYRNRANVRFEHFSGYLFEAARKILIDHGVRATRKNVGVLSVDPPEPSPDHENPHLDALRDCLEQLGENAFVKAIIAQLNGKTTTEIAELGQVEIQTVHSRMTRGRTMLHDCIELKILDDKECAR